MGKLRVSFRIGLSHPLSLPQGSPGAPITIEFPDTGNTVRIKAPAVAPRSGSEANFGAFDVLILDVERDCTDEQGNNTTYANNERLRINRDAGRAFWQLLETLRELALRSENVVAGYPVTPAETIQSNPLVRTCSADWIYNGVSTPQTFGGIATIGIRADDWAEAARRFRSGARVPVYRSFALDALYFATSGDPPRAIIMAFAAWEIALREYLRSVDAKESETLRGIFRLYSSVKAARGGPLFYDELDASREAERDLVDRLPELRNKLLHEGKTDLPQGSAVRLTSAVLDAIDWLFRDAGY